MNRKELTLTSGLKVNISTRSGNDDALVLLSGNSCSSEIFQNLIEHPALSHSIFALDLPGHGASHHSQNPAADYSFAALRESVKEIISGLQLDRFVLAGHSFGGHLAMEVADQLEGLAGLLIFGAPPLKSPLNMEEAFQPNDSMSIYFMDHPGDEMVDKTLESVILTPENRVIVKGEYLSTDPAFRSALGASLGQPGELRNEWEIVETMDRPVYFLNGKNDPTINLDYVRSIQGDHIRQWEIDQCGHYISLEQPHIFLQYLQTVLQECLD